MPDHLTVNAFARRVVLATNLEAKLSAPPPVWDDSDRGPAERIPGPGRPPELTIRPAHEAEVPPIEGMQDPEQRRRILHAFANHELQATELFAWALLAFPDAPTEFRKGLLAILADEQRHTRMYMGRVRALDMTFGEQPVSGYFWNKIEAVRSPMDFICMMSLTFEQANLDHTVAYAEAARQAGDPETAAVIETVETDEVEHVRFGYHWLKEFKNPAESTFEAYESHLTWPLRPALAKGSDFQEEGRRRAGLDETFIRKVRKSER